MKIENDKIVEATEDELYTYWLRTWSDFMPYTEYRTGCISSGIKIKEKDDE